MRFAVPVLIATVAWQAGAQTVTTSLGSRDSLGLAALPPMKPAIGRNSALLMTTALGTGLAMSLFDSRLLGSANSPTELHRTSAVGNLLGGPAPIAIGATLYALGRVTGNQWITGTGREVVRAVAFSSGITTVTKGVVGRSRPVASPGDADEYSPGHGFTGGLRSSFPSGHTAAAFATATVLAREINAAHPDAKWVVDPLLFGAASFVGWSRMYDRQHWPSDVLVGGALGSLVGYEVVSHAHGDRSPLASGLFSHLRLGPSRHGLDVGWSLH